jgi:hypothetical protein
VTLLHPNVPPTHLDEGPTPEALIREARRLRRRRRSIGLLVMAVVGSASGISYAIATTLGDTAGPPRAITAPPRSHLGLPTGPVIPLELAGSLAMGPNGELYVAAPAQRRILVRLADGVFRVVAGDGRAGYAGNGTLAINAELSDPSDLVFGPRGSLYFVDGGRVRVVQRNGDIETVAGNGIDSGKPPGKNWPTIANGTSAALASLGPAPSIALSATGHLYIDTANQLFQLTSSDRLHVLKIRRMTIEGKSLNPKDHAGGYGPLAVGSNGTLYVAGVNGWSIWRVTPSGDATYIAYDRGSGGTNPDLVRMSNGAVYAAFGSTIVRVLPRTLKRVLLLTKVQNAYFWLTNFAFGANGTVYADETPGNVGFERTQQLISVDGAHKRVLWQEPANAVDAHERAGS